MNKDERRKRKIARRLARKLGSIRHRQSLVEVRQLAITTSPTFAHLGSYLILSEVAGARLPPATLISFVKRFGWSHLFYSLANLAATMANQQRSLASDEVERCTKKVLISAARTHAEQRVALYVAAHPDRPLATEATIYFLHALALLECPDGGEVPSDQDIAYLLLAANDYISDWFAEDCTGVSTNAALAAEGERAKLFNRHPDWLTDLARAYALFQLPPKTDKDLNDPTKWEALQAEAFGEPFFEYVCNRIGPLFLMSLGWGLSDGKLTPPLIDVVKSYSQTRLSNTDTLLRELTTTRDAARTTIKRAANGLPIAPTIFYHTPFVEMPDGLICAASPWVVREAARGGLWNKHRVALKLKYPKKPEIWSPAFGELFEGWCKRMALLASESPAMSKTETFVVEEENEVEDVCIFGENAVVLFSIKASPVPEGVLKGAD